MFDRPGPENILLSLIRLIYPDLCVLCLQQTPAGDGCFCLSCLASLPFTEQPQEIHEEFIAHFGHRLQLKHGTSLFHLTKNSQMARLVHRMKYQNRPDIALSLGAFYGYVLRERIEFQEPDCLIPVPLHPRKQRLRGYNQSERIARGLSGILKIPVREGVLVRNKYTDTQTRKNRYERMMNMAGAFQLVKPGEVQNAHVLLIDDVLTTGATLEACAHALGTAPGIRISMLTLVIGQGT